jgi:Uri superfamily endonuclease
MKGSYVIIIRCEKNKTLIIGKLGKIFFKRGFYVYIGSALNGLEQRIDRHIRKDKRLHWHIDYLIEFGKIIDIFFLESKLRNECNLVKKFEKNLEKIDGFGCSDCNCSSHLFYGDINDIISIVKKEKMEKYMFNGNT